MESPMALHSSSRAGLFWRFAQGVREWCAVGLLAVLVAVAPAPLNAASDEPSDLRLEEGRFFIETITVENASRFSPKIIISESLLLEGRTYSEGELRDAVSRIRRLPLILDVELSLRKGSRRGRYDLVIWVRETRLWFWGLDVGVEALSEPFSISGLERTDEITTSNGLIGRRFSTGRHGLVYLAFGGSEGNLQIGYTRYDLFARGGVLGLSLGFSDCSDEAAEASPSDPGDGGCQTEILGLGLDPTYSSWSVLGTSHRLRLTLGVPIEGNHSLRLLASFRHSDSGIRREAIDTDPSRFAQFSEREDLAFNLSWVYNSVDDPVFPTRGNLLEAGLDVRSLAADLTQLELVGKFGSGFSHAESRQIGVLLAGTRHLPVNESHAIYFGGELFVGHARISDLPQPDLELIDHSGFAWTAAATVGHGAFLRRIHRGDRWRDTRWETAFQLFASGLEANPWGDRVPGIGARISTGLTYRNTWGVLRLCVGYLAVENR
jgi:hypothetical protein